MSSVQIVGIDCAAQTKNVGIAVALGSDVTRVVAGDPDPAGFILESVDLSLPTLLAMDAPLGWPRSLSTELSGHRAGRPLHTVPDQLFRRTTDRVVHVALRKPPLEVGADKIARAAHAALRLLEELRQRTGCEFPLLWEPNVPPSHGVIEVYPAGTLKARGLPFQGYKTNRIDHVAVRRELAHHVAARLSLSSGRSLLEQNADALDATLCVIAAQDFLAGRCIEPGEDRAAAEIEGWIWVLNPESPGSAV